MVSTRFLCIPRLAFIFALMAVVAAASPAGSQPRIARPDQEFLAEFGPRVEAVAEEGKDAARSPRGAVGVMRDLLWERSAALQELGGRHPLTELDGIETQDIYDDRALWALEGIVATGFAADTTRPPENVALIYTQTLGPMPDLGSKPVAFMILEMAELAVATTDLLAGHEDISAEDAAKLTLRLVDVGLERYRISRDNIVKTSKTESFRQSSVILRMRCPQDGSKYKLNTMKNRVGAVGQLNVLFYLECEICHQPIVVEYPLMLATKIALASERQNLKKKPEAASPHGGLEP